MNTWKDKLYWTAVALICSGIAGIMFASAGSKVEAYTLDRHIINNEIESELLVTLRQSYETAQLEYARINTENEKLRAELLACRGE